MVLVGVHANGNHSHFAVAESSGPFPNDLPLLAELEKGELKPNRANRGG